MELKQKWLRQWKKSPLWQLEDRVLLAVSGGVDSMVLLDLFLQLPEEIRPFFGIAHVDHQLRTESKEERRWLESFCVRENIPCHTVCWQEGSKIRNNVEEQARVFRYNFFEKMMEEHGYQKLVTAHHADDQAETVLMRLVKGAQLSSLAGIRKRRDFASGELIRPLLDFTKSELLVYAKKYNITYFEDQSNYKMEYFRNQLRWQVLPVLQKENPEISRQLQQFAKKMTFADSIITEKMTELADHIFLKKTTYNWQLNVPIFQSRTRAEQYFLLVHWFEKIKGKVPISVNEQQLQQILHILNQSEPQKTIQLNQQYQFVRRYQWAEIKQVRDMLGFQPIDEKCLLEGNQGRWLSERQWIGLFKADHLDELVEKKVVEDAWIVSDIWLYQNDFPLIVRKRIPGDRMLMDRQHHQKINRIFINEKIPEEERKKAWVLTTRENEVLWCLPYRRSYLSIEQETDKIHYKLIYCEK